MRTLGELLTPYLSPEQHHRYATRQRCSPQPAMRTVVREGRSFRCMEYSEFEWVSRSVVTERDSAVNWWLGDPWLPEDDLA